MCSTSFDCPTNMQCLPGFLSLEVANNVTFCGCILFPYGLSKETPGAEVCSAWGPNTYYQMAVKVLMMTLFLALQIHFGFVLIVLRKHGKIKLNQMMISFLLLFAANTFQLISTLASTVELLTPGVEHFNLGGFKVHPISTTNPMIVLLAESLTLLAISNIPLVWAQVVQRTRNYGLSDDGTKALRLTVRGYQFLVLLSRVIHFGISGSIALTYGVAVAGLGLIGVGIIFLLSRRWFVQLFRKYSSDSLGTNSVLRKIVGLTNVVTISLVIAVVSLVAYVFSTFQGLEAVCSRQQLCWPWLAREITTLAVLNIKVSCQLYCSQAFGFTWCSYEPGSSVEAKSRSNYLGDTSNDATSRKLYSAAPGDRAKSVAKPEPMI